MKSRIKIRWTFRNLFLLALMPMCLYAQVFDPPPPDASPLFDSVRNVVFFGYGTLQAGGPALRAYTNGHQRGGDIDLFKDFPGLQYAVVNSFAAGPAYTSMLAAVLGYGNKVVRHVLLSFGDRGQLLKIWDTDPYYTYALAIDADGDVYTLAVRTDVNDKNGPDYPVLIRYRPDGRVAQKSLPKSIFRGSTAQAITPAGGTILPVLRIKDDRVYVFAPLTREVVMGTKKGGAWERYQLSGIRVQRANTKSEIRNVDFASNGDLVVEVRARTQTGPVTELQRINARTGEINTIKRLAGNGPGMFMGVFDDRYAEIIRDLSGKKVFTMTPFSTEGTNQK